MKVFAPCLCVLALLAPVMPDSAAAPKSPTAKTQLTQEKLVLKVDAPSKVKAGDLIVLSVDSNAASFDWLVLPSTDNFRVFNGGKTLVFASGDLGTYTFIVSGGLQSQTVMCKVTVEVVGDLTPAFSELVLEWCEDIPPPKREDALKLSQSFRTVAQLMKDSMSPEDIVSATIESNRSALGANIENWKPFRDRLGDYLSKLAKDGKLTTVAQHRDLWNQIADSLALIKD